VTGQMSVGAKGFNDNGTSINMQDMAKKRVGADGFTPDGTSIAIQKMVNDAIKAQGFTAEGTSIAYHQRAKKRITSAGFINNQSIAMKRVARMRAHDSYHTDNMKKARVQVWAWIPLMFCVLKSFSWYLSREE
jgi:hypothetical protein